MRTPPMIEFVEWFDGADVRTAKLDCPQLPAGHYCRIERAGQYWTRKTRANGNGSIRYHTHITLADAYAAATAWARRKVAEDTRAALAALRAAYAAQGLDADAEVEGIDTMTADQLRDELTYLSDHQG